MNPQDIKSSIAQKMSKVGNKLKSVIRPNVVKASGNPIPSTPNFSFRNQKSGRLYQGKYPYAVAGGDTDREFGPPGNSSRVYSFNATTTAGQPYEGDYFGSLNRPHLHPTFNVVNGKGVQGQYNPSSNTAELQKILSELKQTPLYDVYTAEGHNPNNW